MDRINEAKIWALEYEVEQTYNFRKNRFKNRMAAETYASAHLSDGSNS